MNLASRISHGIEVLRTSAGLGLLVASLVAPADASLWREAQPVDAPRVPAQARIVQLDAAALEAILAAPNRGEQLIELPGPTGDLHSFQFRTSGVMAPELAAKFPEIRAFRGVGVDSHARTRFEWTPLGFNARVWSDEGKFVIERIDSNRYFVAFTHQFTTEQLGEWTCEFTPDPQVEAEIAETIARLGSPALGPELRTYRTAIAATGEFTDRFGGTVSGGLSGIVQTLNAVNEIYEREVSVTFELIPNNNLIVYTNPATDPYTNGSTIAMLSQNHSNLATVIGSANYDHGHVFGIGGGGVATLAAVCRSNAKGRGVSTGSSVTGASWELLVAHEMGHQFGASHSFNGTEGNCGPNRTASTAYEPGSGSTIMAYAGICGSHNLQFGADDYFNAVSYDQIANNITSGSGSCGAISSTGNSPPNVVAGNSGFTIPTSTPFLLDGSATDPNGDTLSYCWEQTNTGPAGDPDAPSGNAPIFRSFLPKVEKTFRFFPKRPRILDNVHVIGELSPTYARTLNFRLTVRDEFGGVNFDETSVVVDGGSGPFQVTSPNTAVTWVAGEMQTVTWDVANTDNGSVDCQTVNILLSDDGGFDYPFTLAANTPNDGSETILVPAASTTEARIQVEAADNIFLDISDADFTVMTPTDVTEVTQLATGLLGTPEPNPLSEHTRVRYTVPHRGEVSLRIFDAAGRLVRTLANGVEDAGDKSVSWDGRNSGAEQVVSGVYFIRYDTPGGGVEMQKVLLVR